MLILWVAIYLIFSLFVPSGLFLFNIRPDFLLIAVVFMGLFNIRGGIFFALCLGLFRDVYTCAPFGLNTFCLVLWFAAAWEVSRRMYKDNRLLYVLLAMFFTYLNYIVYFFVLSFSSGGNTAEIKYYIPVMVMESLYNIIFSFWLFNIFKRCALRYSLR